ncbi:bifunctional diguanylate cyclase/phosphodiesterase [soil metagenome]
MRFNSLASRIVILFLILILAVQVTGFIAISKSINDNARKSISVELEVGEKVFNRLLDQNSKNLTTGAQVLARDTGFGEAVGTNDRETIGSALLNSANRIGAKHALLIGTDRKIIASSSGTPAANLEQSILEVVGKAELAEQAADQPGLGATGKQGVSATGVSIVERQPFQVVVVPVKLPITVGWVAMAFPIDGQVAADMRVLSGLDVSILTGGNDGKWMVDASTLAANDAAGVAQQLTGKDNPGVIANEQYSARVLTLVKEAGQTAVVVLQRSIGEAIAPYDQLKRNLMMLTILVTVFAAAISFFTVKRITGPLRKLGETAKRLGAGDFEGQIAIRRKDEIGDLSRAFESMRDGIANRELEIRRLAYWDSLTNLPNRAQFSDSLTAAITDAKDKHSSCFILMMDLDRFKNVNDVLGQSFGDALLRQFGQRLQQQIAGKAEMVARLGGDEFTVLLPHTSIHQAKEIAARILKSLESPLSLDDQTVDLGAGIGIAGYPDHGADAEIILSRAEVAMYAAKKSGNEAVVYDPALDKSSQQSLSLLSELRQAVDDNQFRLYVQPKILLGTGKLIGVEALVRWVHPEKGMIFPDQFIPFAESSGFIRILTRWVLEQSGGLCRDLAANGLHPKISVNLSARDLLDQELPLKFQQILERHQLTAASFCLEITESSIMDDPMRSLQTLEGLHAMGVDLSIDDFGTGYSSLAYLKRLPVDELKIDKSFVLNMEKDAGDAKIVRSTIDLAHNMGLRVVAEGIETAAVWEILAKMGCDQGQGYFIAKPMPADQLVKWMEGWAPSARLLESIADSALQAAH